VVCSLAVTRCVLVDSYRNTLCYLGTLDGNNIARCTNVRSTAELRKSGLRWNICQRPRYLPWGTCTFLSNYPEFRVPNIVLRHGKFMQKQTRPYLSSLKSRDFGQKHCKRTCKSPDLRPGILFLHPVYFRMANGLSINLLELNTFAHTFCALATYLLWWDKPLDVEEPILLA
jgi:hypothetical protein